MEKILSLFAAMILLLCGTFTVFASELGESEISQENLFASKAAYTSIVQNLNDEQIDQFFDEEVSLDLQHLVPVYIPTGDSSDNTLLNMLEFTNTYNTVVYSKDGEVLGTATLEFYENKWVVGTFYRGYNMLEKMGALPASTNQTLYYIDNPYTQEQALLVVGQDAETYRSLTNAESTISASEIVKEINKMQQLNGTFADGTGANANDTTLIPYTVSSFIIIFAIAASIFICRKKASQ